MGIYENSPPHTEESVSDSVSVSEDTILSFLHFLRLGHLVIGIWCLFVIWCLELGA